MTDVTVTGGSSHPIVNLGYTAVDSAYFAAKSLAAAVTAAFENSVAQVDSVPGGPLGTDNYLIAEKGAIGKVVNGQGYAAITVDNVVTAPGAGLGPNGPLQIAPPSTATTVRGGMSGSYGENQTVLASNGGLYYLYNNTSGNVSVAALGGNNYYDFRGNASGSVFATAGGGSDTAYAGGGYTNIDLELGNNYIFLGAGSDSVTTEGNDSITLGAGTATISVVAQGTAIVNTASTPTVPAGTYSLIFNGGSSASTVSGSPGNSNPNGQASGLGSYSINAGLGGGWFVGGASGNNYITGGQTTNSAAVTIFGGSGGGDTLIGANLLGQVAALNVLVAGGGDETILGGIGSNSINAGTGSDSITLQAGTDTVGLGAGSATVNASAPGVNVLVDDPVGGANSTLDFIGGGTASTVLAGAGSYTINGGSASGNVFHGGTGNNVTSDNYIYGGSGAYATIFGGRGGDTLIGANGGENVINAGLGNETLIASANGFDTLNGAPAGAGGDDFVFTNENGTFSSYTVTNFVLPDLLTLKSAADATYAASHQTIAGGNNSISLSDGTTITLVGETTDLVRTGSTLHLP
jgi:hypothetical protein